MACFEWQDADPEIRGNHLAHGVETANLNAQPQGQPGAFGGSGGEFEQGTTSIESDEIMRKAVLEPDFRVLRNRVTGGTYDHQVIRLKGFDIKPEDGRVFGKNPEIRKSVDQGAHDVSAELLLEFDPDIRVEL